MAAIVLSPLITARLALRPPQKGDVEAMLDYDTRNLAHFAASSPQRGQAWLTETACRDRIAEQLEEIAQGKAAYWLVFLRDAATSGVIGHVSVTAVQRGVFQAAYIGYGIEASQCGKGFATEAMSAAIGHAFGTMNLHRLMANHLPGNASSARVLAKLGFVEEGLARDYLFLGGQWRDHVLTSLTNPDWATT